MRRIMTTPIDEHRAKILRFLEDADKDMSEASLAMGRNRAYLQQYITRGVPKKLHQEDREALAAMVHKDEKELREPAASARGPLTIAKSVDRSMGTRLPVPERGARDLPVRGLARGAQDVILNIEDTPVDWVERPASLAGAPDAFAVYVAGDSMNPILKAGSLVYVSPAKPVRNGDFVLVEKVNGEAVVKILEGQNTETIKLVQLNPHKVLSVAREDVKTLFRIVTVDFP